jgi:outer membrane protein assembly factor BamB
MRIVRGILAVMALAGCGVSVLWAQIDGSLKWRFSTGGYVVSSPAVAADGTIYVGSESRRLFAINPNGSLKWAYPSLAIIIPFTDWFDASPTIGADGTIYAGNFDGRLYALNPNGTLKWSFLTSAYISSSVAIGPDGALFFGSGDGAVYALNPDGTLRWSYETGDWVDSSPAVGPDGTVYVGSWDFNLYALNPNGTLKWKVPTGNTVVSSPAVGGDGTVYVGSGDGKLYAVRPDGSVAWTYLTGDVVDCSPAVGSDGTIYFGSGDGRFYALRPDGTPAWAAPFTVGQGVFGGVLVRGDGTIIFGASDRYIYALKADGTLKWKYAAGDVVDSSAAIGPDGTIYIGSFDARLYALNGSGSGLSSAPWPKFHHDALNQGRVTGAALPTPPTITTPPQTQSVAYGASVTFSADASGTLPFSYQWQKNGADIAGATGASLVLSGVKPADGGLYRVRVSNSVGAATSAAATLTVAAAIGPAITVQPRPLVVGTGRRLSLWVIATGSPPVTYQWYKNGSPIAGATSAFYEVAASSAADAGSYTVRVTNDAGELISTVVTVGVVDGASGRLINLSSRAFVGTGDSILIPGLVVGGTGTRRLLVRAVGPTLAGYGVSGVLANPQLTIKSGDVSLFSNDNWGSSPNAAEIASTAASVYAFPLAAGSADAAALVDLTPGSYTVLVSGVGDTTGIALVETYDVAAVGAGAGRLVNISSRGFTGTGDAPMIPGFVIEGNAAKTLLIRAVGPTLSNYGVSNVLPDPVLRLYEMVQGVSHEILVQDNWPDAPDPVTLAAISAGVYAFPLENGSADASMLVVLMPGIYTAIASGAGGTTGNALVEVYEVD